jgi:hypothetical protein
MTAKVPATIIEQEPGRITLARKNDLAKLLKTMEKATPDALEVLLAAMKDETVDMKIRVDIAKKIVETRVSLSESISKDQLMRSIGEHRMRMAEQGPRKITDVEEDDEAPRALFVPSAILAVDSQNV